MTSPDAAPSLSPPLDHAPASSSSTDDARSSPAAGSPNADAGASSPPAAAPAHTTDGDDARRQRELAAATTIQRRWKGRQKRSAPDVKLSSDDRWKQALFNAEGVKQGEAASEGKNLPKERWHRALHASTQLQNGKAFSSSGRQGSGDDADGESPLQESRKTAALSKTLEEQHWLEMLDPKHRYGSSLKYYHKAWTEDETTQDNFYKWLDRGNGKDLSLPECSREQLEKDRITYLSVEQRLNYYVTVDKSDGRLRWYKNGRHVDTAPRKWTDGGPDVGVVPKDQADADQEYEDAASDSSSSSSSSDQSDEAQHYAGHDHSRDPGPVGKLKTFFESFTMRGATDRLLRKTVGKDKFIFVVDLDFHMFVGIKRTGAFQHSSFLSGGRVTAAGLITVRNGLITGLSPLSGHYRTNIDHFKEFLTEMEKQGADMSKIKVTKAELIMFGLEKYGKVSKTVGRAKKSMLHPHATAADRETERRKAQEQEDAKRKAASEADAPVDSKKSLADFKRDLLYGRKTSGAAQGLQKLAQKASGKDDGEKAPDAGSAAAANASTPKPASAPSTGTERPQTDEGKTDA